MDPDVFRSTELQELASFVLASPPLPPFRALSVCTEPEQIFKDASVELQLELTI